MLPDIPSLQSLGQFPILQQWMGVASLILVAFGIYVSIRKMNRDDRQGRTDKAVDSPLANMPKYYMEGPILKAFQMLEDILARLKDLSETVDKIQERVNAIRIPDEDRRRRR